MMVGEMSVLWRLDLLRRLPGQHVCSPLTTRTVKVAWQSEYHEVPSLESVRVAEGR